MTAISIATIALAVVFVSLMLAIVANDRRAYLVLEAKALEDQMQAEFMALSDDGSTVVEQPEWDAECDRQEEFMALSDSQQQYVKEMERPHCPNCRWCVCS